MEKKTTCKFCGVQILQQTADRTNGYCKPHEKHGIPFLERIPGVISSSKSIDFSSIDPKNYSRYHEELLTLLIERLKREQLASADEFKFIEFNTKSDSEEPMTTVSLGYAIVKYPSDKGDGATIEWIDGVVVEYDYPPSFYEDVIKEISLIDYLKSYVSANEIENFVKNYQYGDKFQHFRSSQHSWMNFFGREYIYWERNGKVISLDLIMMN